MSTVHEMNSWTLIEHHDPVTAARVWERCCRTCTRYDLLNWMAARLLLDAPLIRRHLDGFVDDGLAQIDFDGLLAHMSMRESRNLCRMVQMARELAWGEAFDEPLNEWMAGLDEENGKRLAVAVLVSWGYRPGALV